MSLPLHLLIKNNQFPSTTTSLRIVQFKQSSSLNEVISQFLLSKNDVNAKKRMKEENIFYNFHTSNLIIQI